jgi:biofilm PGA synthesis N-glycosyltransferase PgaC
MHIAQTLDQILKLEYPDYEIIVIDDGSTDQTAAIARDYCQQHDRVRIAILKHNQGKAAALNLGALMAKGELLLTIDADALVAPDALTWMVWHFENYPRVGAVTGNPRVLNRTSLLAKIQIGEYSTIIGLIKRTQRILGKVLTVSGVISAFRKKALMQVGFWDTDMVTEDIDITWKLEKDFWDIRFEPRSVCWIRVPETLKGIWRQRKRWAQGSVEVLKRHINIWKDPRQRRLWPVYAESVTSIVWAYCFWALVLGWTVSALTGIWPIAAFSPPVPPAYSGSILALICILQFIVSMYVDRRYEQKSAKYLFWVIWYPFIYWMISSLSVIVAAPKALLKRKGTPAVWKSPDRGLDTFDAIDAKGHLHVGN